MNRMVAGPSTERKVWVSPRGRKPAREEEGAARPAGKCVVAAVGLHGAVENNDRLVLMTVAVRWRPLTIDDGPVDGKTAAGGVIGALHLGVSARDALLRTQHISLTRYRHRLGGRTADLTRPEKRHARQPISDGGLPAGPWRRSPTSSKPDDRGMAAGHARRTVCAWRFDADHANRASRIAILTTVPRESSPNSWHGVATTAGTSASK